MEYTVTELAGLAGVSARTLRYYDQIGLLCPGRTAENGYRRYGEAEVDRLQQILFYRELGVPLAEIGVLLNTPDYDRESALLQHLSALLQKREQLERLIANVQRTISATRGEEQMDDREKFEGFQRALLAEHEEAYGAEVRTAYGTAAEQAVKEAVLSMDKVRWEETETLRMRCEELLREAVPTGDPAGAMAREMCELHRSWLCRFWGKEHYSAEAHTGLAQLYVSDERFTAYYEKIVPGGARFLCEALTCWCGEMERRRGIC